MLNNTAQGRLKYTWLWQATLIFNYFFNLPIRLNYKIAILTSPLHITSKQKMCLVKLIPATTGIEQEVNSSESQTHIEFSGENVKFDTKQKNGIGTSTVAKK